MRPGWRLNQPGKNEGFRQGRAVGVRQAAVEKVKEPGQCLPAEALITTVVLRAWTALK